jgi:hypothetical protein
MDAEAGERSHAPALTLVASNASLVCRLHAEPLTDVLFTEDAIFTACHGGQVKCWARPSAAGKVAAGSMPGAAAPEAPPA